MYWVYPDERYYYEWYDTSPSGQGPPATDASIKAAVVDRLRDNPHTADCKLRVDVKRGVVILQGVVPSRVAKRAAGDDCWDTPGVADVSNQLEVNALGDVESSQTKVADAMSQPVVTVGLNESVAAAAARMRDQDIGSVVVVSESGAPRGVLTDRDIVVRCVAAGAIPESSTAAEICSGVVASVKPDDDLDEAVELMRERAIRRVPVVEHDHVVGVLSLGDLARVRDPGSALADISGASPTAV